MPHQDQKYIDALIDENQDVIKEIYKKWFPQCKRFVLKNGGTEEDAKDIFQEALIAISLRIRTKKIELTVPFEAYLYRVYKNVWIGWRKKKKLNIPLNIIDANATENVSDSESEIRDSIFKECFDKLNSSCKKLLTMRIIGMQGKEIASELFISSPNTVDQKMYDCRRQLRKLVQSHPLYKELHKNESSSSKRNLEKNKEEILNELAGSWSDVDDSIIEDIYKNRTTSSKNIDLDQ